MARDWKTNPAQTYGTLCKEVIAVRGYKPGEVPIISRKEHPREWREWYAWYGLRKLWFSQELMRERDTKTVPTLSPFSFDTEFSLPEYLPEVPDERAEPRIRLSPAEQARMRLKSPMLRYANANGLVHKLDKANKRGQAAMIDLAHRWGIEVPVELLAIPTEIAEREWHEARGRALAEMGRNPPPFVRKLERMRTDNAHRQILAENVTAEEYKLRSAAGEFPPGSSLVAMLNTVYGP